MPGLLRILLVILFLAVAATGTTGAVSLPSGSASDATTALAKEGHGGNKGKGDEKKHDNGKTEDEKDKDKDKKDKDKSNKGRGKAVVPVADYAVEVTCAYDAATGRTTCTFQGITPEGGKQIGHLDLAGADVCAEVVGGDYEAIDPDPNTGVTGFKSRGSEGRITLILQGEVAVEGTITYWVKAANNVFPVPGPGLRCDAADEAVATPPAEEATDPSGGTLVVTVATCPEKPADPVAYDWYGMCQPEESELEYTLADVTTGADPGVTPETTGEGERTYTTLEPGTYTFSPVSDSWCHAESDNVNAEGQLIIGDGETTHLWIFNCPRAAGS